MHAFMRGTVLMWDLKPFCMMKVYIIFNVCAILINTIYACLQKERNPAWFRKAAIKAHRQKWVGGLPVVQAFLRPQSSRSWALFMTPQSGVLLGYLVMQASLCCNGSLFVVVSLTGTCGSLLFMCLKDGTSQVPSNLMLHPCFC